MSAVKAAQASKYAPSYNNNNNNNDKIYICYGASHLLVVLSVCDVSFVNMLR